MFTQVSDQKHEKHENFECLHKFFVLTEKTQFLDEKHKVQYNFEFKMMNEKICLVFAC